VKVTLLLLLGMISVVGYIGLVILVPAVFGLTLLVGLIVLGLMIGGSR
jgi:hypothetical protein